MERNLTNLKKTLLVAVLIIILDALAACTSMPAPATTSIPTQSPTAVIPPVTSATPTPSPSSTASPSPTGTTNTIEFGSRTLTNNTWGAPVGENLTSGVYLSNNGSFGWYWNRTDPKVIPGNNGVQPIFPNVRIGGSLTEQSNSVYFPIQLSQIKSLTLLAAYDYLERPTGQYNLAYEMLLSETNLPSSNPIRKAEVMIWLHGTFTQPPSSYKGDFTDGYNTYALYSWIMSGTSGDFLYCSFIMKGQPEFQAQHTADAKRLLDNLDLDPSWYIHGIELGSEILSGTGKIEISKLVVNVNGHEP